MRYGFDEALKVMKAGYKVGFDGWTDPEVHPQYMRIDGTQLVVGNSEVEEPVFALLPSHLLSDEWFTVDPPHITGILDMHVEDAGMAAV